METSVFDIVRGFARPENYPGRELRNACSEKWHSREEELQTSRSDVEAAWTGQPGHDVESASIPMKAGICK